MSEQGLRGEGFHRDEDWLAGGKSTILTPMSKGHKKPGQTCLRRRRSVLSRARRKRSLDAVLVTTPRDVSYLSGFTGEDSFLLFSRRWCVLLTDGRYTEQAGKECEGIDVFTRTGGMAKAVGTCLKGRRVRRLGVQADALTLAWRDTLDKAVGGRTLVPLSSMTSTCRMVKDDGEVKAIRKAIRIAQSSFQELIAGGAKGLEGLAEREVAANLEYLMRCAGADGASFETIVAAGPGSSQPHYRPGSRRLRKGDAVLIDWGARVGGYCSDLTRVLFLRRIPPKFKEIYPVVLEAQQRAVDAIRPGRRCSTIDAAAREVIDEAGFGPHFVHSLGHGVGRDVHEAPALGRSVSLPLRRGMVVTVEPGIYLPGVGGVRIEDDVLVTPNGAKRLSSLSRSMETMVLA